MSSVVLTGAHGGLASHFVSSYTTAHPSDRLLSLVRSASPDKPDEVAFDMTDLDLVKRTAASIRSRVDSGELARISALICCASAQRVAGMSMVDAGEETIVVNHLAHLALILELLPALTPDAVIVIFGAEAYRPDYKFFKLKARYEPLEALLRGQDAGQGEGDVEWDERDRGLQRYSTSKLLQMMTGNELAARLEHSKYPGVRVVLYNPGTMGGTGLFREHGLGEWTVMQASLAVPALSNWLEPELGAARPQDSAALLQRIVEGDVRGRYIGPDGEEWEQHPAAMDPSTRAELWQDSVRVLGYEDVL